jgi:hypothetical protein
MFYTTLLSNAYSIISGSFQLVDSVGVKLRNLLTHNSVFKKEVSANHPNPIFFLYKGGHFGLKDYPAK